MNVKNEDEVRMVEVIVSKKHWPTFTTIYKCRGSSISLQLIIHSIYIYSIYIMHCFTQVHPNINTRTLLCIGVKCRVIGKLFFHLGQSRTKCGLAFLSLQCFTSIGLLH